MGRYAHVEREQRWLCAAVPPGAERYAEITDRYLHGTRLRLRVVETDDDDAEEYEAVRALPAAELRKTRWRVTWEGHQRAVDEFHGPLGGLVLAEVELGLDDPFLPSPPFARLDVTHDDRYSGGALAASRP